MTICESLGHKEGDLFTTISKDLGHDTQWPIGTTVKLLRDDGSICPLFSLPEHELKDNDCSDTKSSYKTIGVDVVPLDVSLPDQYNECKIEPVAKRFNDGKVDYTMVPLDALTEEARVWMAGEAKYGRDNWTKLWGEDTVNVVLASLLRHAYAIQSGEENDPESGLQHAGHIRANAAMLVRHFNSIRDEPVSS